MPQQLSFDLPVRPALGRGDFFVSPANALAVALIEDWQNWPGRKLLLSGPQGAGKSHLAHVWAEMTGAPILAAPDLPQADIPALSKGSVVVEDIPAIADDPDAQTALFHLHNLVLAEGHHLLLTGRGEPHLWGLTLPDLASRMQGTQAATLNEPDDALLGAVLMKLFADRQLFPAPDLVPYLVHRIDRSFAAAQDVVDQLDKAALAMGRKLNASLARHVIAK